ncbi:hypothetical protein NL676_033891 [Syzygium grande]|nr:hypothetical protein NL676_033891 [Syzygium grande]
MADSSLRPRRGWVGAASRVAQHPIVGRTPKAWDPQRWPVMDLTPTLAQLLHSAPYRRLRLPLVGHSKQPHQRPPRTATMLATGPPASGHTYNTRPGHHSPINYDNARGLPLRAPTNTARNKRNIWRTRKRVTFQNTNRGKNHIERTNQHTNAQI